MTFVCQNMPSTKKPQHSGAYPRQRDFTSRMFRKFTKISSLTDRGDVDVADVHIRLNPATPGSTERDPAPFRKSSPLGKTSDDSVCAISHFERQDNVRRPMIAHTFHSLKFPSFTACCEQSTLGLESIATVKVLVRKTLSLFRESAIATYCKRLAILCCSAATTVL